MQNASQTRFCGISMSVADYDDTTAIRAYVATHCRHFMTPLERRSTEYGTPIISTSENTKVLRLHAFLEERDGHSADAATIAAFKTPLSIRESNAISRVIKNHLDELPLNRCPECARLVRTPRAEQCLWCGHDWH